MTSQHTKHWYTATKSVAHMLNADGCPIKEKPPVRVSSKNGNWLVLCDANQLYVAEIAASKAGMSHPSQAAGRNRTVRVPSIAPKAVKRTAGRTSDLTTSPARAYRKRAVPLPKLACSLFVANA